MAGVLNHKQVANAYGNDIILLLLGGFILSTAIEKSGVHRHLAIGMVRLVGSNGNKNLVLGFMLASAFISMWISNTATTLMLIPVAIAILEHCEEKQVATPLLLGIAYAANIGGVGTPIGTPPNLIFFSQYSELMGTSFSFLQWIRLGFPVVLFMVPLMWLWLTRNLKNTSKPFLPELGTINLAQKRVLIIFSITALAWMTRIQPFGGWSQLLGTPGVGDSTVALFMVVLMFLIPDGKGGKLLDWETASQIPWGLLILIAGGIAIANAFSSSGLSIELGQVLSGISILPKLIVIVSICSVVTFLTEVTSNTATTSVMMPILAALALQAKLDPALVMIPATLSASCAFMLPVATPPNAVVYSTGEFSISRMAREGLILNLIGVVVITGLSYIILG